MQGRPDFIELNSPFPITPKSKDRSGSQPVGLAVLRGIEGFTDQPLVALATPHSSLSIAHSWHSSLTLANSRHRLQALVPRHPECHRTECHHNVASLARVFPTLAVDYW